ncbi:flavodoxin domain-containing protein [Allokutzneria oryzae]|uniref:Flavodoxin domain-containing protein n=1 Tax=Allokutzneria oryzae TaxID=1378989 RepID=A0ABV6A378_9PSEU
MTKALVTYTGRRGAVVEIADEVATVLRGKGHEVDLLPVHRVRDLRPYRVVVLGSAVYAGRWSTAAARFLRHNVSALSVRQVWLFACGPLRTDPDLLPTKVDMLVRSIGAADPVVFGGAARTAGDSAVPWRWHSQLAGDHLDRKRIVDWAREIARRAEDAQPPPEPPRRPQWTDEVAAVTGVVFLLASFTNLCVILLAPRQYVTIAEWAGAPEWVREVWTATAGTYPWFWMTLVAVYQLVVGAFALSGSRRLLGLAGAALFHVGLLALGLWLYAAPVLVLLLAALWSAAKPPPEKEKP